MPTPSGTQACSHAHGRVRRARYPCPSPIAPRRIQHSLRQRSFMSSQCITTCCTYRPLARPMPSILWAVAASSTVTRMPQSAVCRCATQPKIFTYSISWPKWERFIARVALALALPHDNRTECPLARVLRWGGYWTPKILARCRSFITLTVLRYWGSCCNFSDTGAMNPRRTRKRN